MWSWILAAISGIASLAGAFIDNKNGKSVANGVSSLFGKGSALAQDAYDKEYNAEQAEENREFQRAERLATQEFNLHMWNENNDYNSPAAQIERARAAGQNLNTLFDGGTTNFSNPVSSSPMMGSYASHAGGLGAEMITADALTQQMLSQAGLNKSNEQYNQYKLYFEKLTQQQRIDLLFKQGQSIDKQIAKWDSEINATDIDNDVKLRSFEHLLYMDDAKRENILANTRKIYNENYEIIQAIKESQKRVEVMDKDIELKDSSIAVNEQKVLNMQQDIYESTHRIGEIISRTNVNEQQSNILEDEAAIKEIEKQLAEALGVPLGTPEWMFLQRLIYQGTFWEYTNYVVNKFNVGVAEGVGAVAGSAVKGAINTPTGSNKGSATGTPRGYINP